MQITIPTKWEDVSVAKFDELVKASHNKDLTIAEREVKIISILTGLSVTEVMNLEAPSFQAISNSLNFLNTKPPKTLPKDKITLNGKDYHVDLYPKNFSAGQFLDYKVLAGEDIDKKTARLVACFLYPEGAQYNDGTYDVEEVVNTINEYMSVVEVTAYTNFFMIQYVAYANSLLEYSKRQVKKSKVMSKQEKQEVLKNLDNAKASISSSGI